jgi:hypothetical protein
MALALAMFVVSHRLQLYAPAAALDLSLSTGAPHEHLGPQRCSTSAAVGRQQPSRTRPSIGTYARCVRGTESVARVSHAL